MYKCSTYRYCEDVLKCYWSWPLCPIGGTPTCTWATKRYYSGIAKRSDGIQRRRSSFDSRYPMRMLLLHHHPYLLLLLFLPLLTAIRCLLPPLCTSSATLLLLRNTIVRQIREEGAPSFHLQEKARWRELINSNASKILFGFGTFRYSFHAIKLPD